MRKTRLVSGVILWISVVSCSHGRTRDPKGDPPRVTPSVPAPTPAEPLPATKQPVSGDTEAELIPNPALRTWNRLWALRNWIRRYEAEHGTLPLSIEQFVPGASGGIDLENDGWGRSMMYRVSGGAYELRSAGPDGAPGTSDDMIATRDKLPERPGPM